MTRWLCALMFVVMACLAFPAVAPAESVGAFLTRAFNLTTQGFAVLEERRSLIRTLGVADDREMSTLGAVRANVPAAFYIDQLRDIVAFKRSSAVRQIGVFSTSARPDDAAALTLDADDDVEDLARCRPGSSARVAKSRQSDALLRVLSASV